MWFTSPKADPSKTIVHVAQCPCGHDMKHGLVRKDCEYGFGGLMMAIFFGGLSRPRKVSYRCGHCETLIAESTDPAVLFTFH